MNTFVKLIITLVVTICITACDGGRYEGLRLWAPGEPDHESICGVKDWKTDEVLLVDEIPEGAWDKSEWSWVPREGCPQ